MYENVYEALGDGLKTNEKAEEFQDGDCGSLWAIEGRTA